MLLFAQTLFCFSEFSDTQVHVVVEEPVLQEAVLELQPWPVLQLAWHGGPVDEDAEPQAAPPPVATAPSLTAVSSDGSSSSSRGEQEGGSGFPGLVLAFEEEVGTAGSSSNSGSSSGRKRELEDLSNQQLQEQWQQLQVDTPADDAAGVPLMWLDFKPPFAEPPPVLVPPKPELGEAPAIEAVLLEELPLYQEPVLQLLPVLSEPPLVVPKWVPPCEPLPIGFLRGAAPLLIMDVSGTMHPAQRGQIHRVKSCVAGLLTPTGA